MKTYHEIVDDLVLPSAVQDATLHKLYRQLYEEHMAKGLVYVEPAWSKFMGHLKYLVVTRPPKVANANPEITILDLDTNQESCRI